MPKKVTIRELAAALSLSPTTVSLTLSGKGEVYRIAGETRRRIEETAARMGYRPNHMARSMRRGKSDTIGVIFPDVSETFMNRVLSGIETVALEKSVSVMIATSSLNPDSEARNLNSLLDRDIDGLLLVPYAPFRNEHHDTETLRRVLETGMPAVSIDRYVPDVTTHAVIGADREAAFLATRKLIASGCRRPAYLGFDLAITTLDERRKGFHDAVTAGGLSDSAEEKLLTERNPKGTDIRDWLSELTISERFPDGFLVSTGGLALKLRSLVGGSGRISRPRTGRRSRQKNPLIARFGEDSPYFPTGMISIRQPHEELGRRAAEKMFRLIAGETIQEKQKIEILDMEIIDETRYR